MENYIFNKNTQTFEQESALCAFCKKDNGDSATNYKCSLVKDGELNYPSHLGRIFSNEVFFIVSRCFNCKDKHETKNVFKGIKHLLFMTSLYLLGIIGINIIVILLLKIHFIFRILLNLFLLYKFLNFFISIKSKDFEEKFLLEIPQYNELVNYTWKLKR